MRLSGEGRVCAAFCPTPCPLAASPGATTRRESAGAPVRISPGEEDAAAGKARTPHTTERTRTGKPPALVPVGSWGRGRCRLACRGSAGADATCGLGSAAGVYLKNLGNLGRSKSPNTQRARLRAECPVSRCVSKPSKTTITSTRRLWTPAGVRQPAGTGVCEQARVPRDRVRCSRAKPLLYGTGTGTVPGYLCPQRPRLERRGGRRRYRRPGSSRASWQILDFPFKALLPHCAWIFPVGPVGSFPCALIGSPVGVYIARPSTELSS